MTIKVTYNVTDIYVSESVSATYINVSYEAPSGGGGAVWGDIIGTLSDQTDLQNALNAKVPYTGATANVDLGEFELKAGQIEFDQTPTGVASAGVMRWNDTTGVSETTLKGGSVLLRNGVDLVARVVNKVSPNTTLTKAAYQAVRVSGAQGQRLAVAFAQANNDANSADTIGLVTETIATNQEGFIMAVGQLENINTTGSLQGETWADGDVLYLSPFTAGRITNIKPIAPNHIIVIGYVEYAHVNNGKIYVKVMNGWELGELHDVNTTGAVAGNVLKYNGTIWTPSGDVGITSLNGLTATTQTFSLDTRGNDVAIVSSGSNHEFIFPSASTTRRGVLTSSDWSLFFNKIGGSGTIGTMPIFTGTGAIGNSIVNITNGLVNIDGVGNLSDYALQIGTGRTNNGFAYIDLVGDTTYSDYGFRLMRNNTGANATSVIEHRGTGDFIFKTVDNANLYFQTGSTNRVFVESNSGALNVANSSAVFLSNTGEQLIVNGSAKFANTLTANSLVKSGGTSSQYLMADGSTSTLTNPVTGTGVSGQVAYWSGTNTQTGSNNLFWDATNSRLRINTQFLAGNEQTFNVYGSALFQQAIGDGNKIYIGNNTSLASADGRLLITPFQIKLNDRLGTLKISADNIELGAAIYLNGRDSDGGSLLLAAANNGALKIFGATRNIAIQNGGTFTDSGQRLQVNGDTLMTGNLTLNRLNNTTFTFANACNFSYDVTNTANQLLYTSASSSILIKFPNASFGTIINATSATQTSTTTFLIAGRITRGANIFDISVTPQYHATSQILSTASFSGAVNFDPTNNTTGSIHSGINIAETFAPNTANKDIRYIGASIQPTINQSGGLTQITRGLYVNPTLTAAADWRSIEWSNNTGWGLYGAGTANNYLAGALGVGTTPLYSLDVLSPTSVEPVATPVDNYAARFKRTYTNNNASVAARRWNTFFDTTYNGNQAFTNASGIFSYINYANTNASSVVNGITAYVEPTSTSVSSIIRTNVSQLGVGGTITNAVGYYSYLISLTAGTTTNVKLFQADTTGTTNTITNLYGFISESTLTNATNNFGFYGNIAAGTGRWNLYMNGTAANYMAGTLSIGTTGSTRQLTISGTGTNVGIDLTNTAASSIYGTFRVLNVGTDNSTIVGSVSNNNFLLYSANAERARFFTNGNLAIGSTTDSGEKLQVTGTMKVTGASTFGGTVSARINLISDATYQSIIDYSSATGLWYFNNRAGGSSTTDYFQYQADGSAILTMKKSGAATFSSSVTSTQFRLSALNTAPATAASTGTLGEIRIDADYIYICTATNTWKRVAIATW